MSSDIKTLFSFPGTGLDTDSDLVTIQNGDSRYRLNVILSDDGNHNVITNTLGNEIKSRTLPSGTNTVVGYVEDRENSAGIHFIHNSNNNHQIVRYNASSETFTDIITNSEAILDTSFTANNSVDAGIIGNEDDQFLVWADGGVLKMINIAYAIAGNYGTITEEKISFYKYPLYSSTIANITTDYQTSIPRSPNTNLTNKIFQFAIRLKYYDKSLSVFSNYSEISFPVENLPSGKLSSDIDYDYIRVSFNIDNEPSVVDSYQLLYRNVDIGGGVSGSWLVYGEYEYSSKGVKTISFKNDQSIGSVSDAESVRPYDYIPNKSSHVGVIDANRIVTDVAEEGFDNVDISVSTDWDEVAIPTASEGIELDFTSIIAPSGNVVVSKAIDPSNDWFYSIDYNFNTYTLYTYGLTGKQVYDSFKDYFGSLNITDLSITTTSSSITFTLGSGGASAFVYAYAIGMTPAVRSLKVGSKYKFGIEYGYNGRRGSVQTDSDFTLQAPNLSDVSSVLTNFSIEGVVDILHSPPAGATDYRIVSFGSDTDYFEEYAIRYNTADLTDDTSYYTMFLEEPYTVIKRDDMVNRMRGAYGDDDTGIDYGMDIVVGDTIKFVGYFVQGGLSTLVNYDAEIAGGELEYRVDVVTDTEIKISSSAIRNVSSYNNPLYYDYWVIQVIRKKDSFDSIAQEFSLSYPIVNGYHWGNTQNQTSGQPAKINITDDFADCWKTKQVYINENNSSDYTSTVVFDSYAWMEKPKISLYYDSLPESQGRVNAVNDLSEAKQYSAVRWGGKFIDDLGVNYLTRFESSNIKDVDERNGLITKIIQIGDTLKVYQKRKSNSLYLKTTSSDDPNGSSTFVFSDNVMSDPRQAIPDYSCTHFTSYAKNVSAGFFFDIVNKSVLRDTQGGIIPISDGNGKMHSYFKAKANAILDYGEDLVKIYGVYDDDFDLYTIAFIVPGDTSHSINDCLSFHEPSGRWVTHFSIPIANALQFMGRLSGKPIVSFVDGQLYLHAVNSVRNNFWGEQFHSEVWLHANEAPDSNKIFNSIGVNSKGSWSCPDEDSIEINKPSLMRSRIVSGRFKTQEGIMRSDFLRNALNGAGAFIRKLLINGKLLRGREMAVKLKSSDTTESQLETVVIQSTISK